MRGFPSVLNTKEDYIYVSEHFPAEQWKPEFQKLLDTMKDWVFVRYLSEGEVTPIADDYKVVEPSGQMGDEKTALYHFEVVPSCKLLSIGFTEQEVREYLAR